MTTRDMTQFRAALTERRKTLDVMLGSGQASNRFAAMALSMIQANPKLMDCSPTSFVGFVVACADLRLEPRLGLVYPVPYGGQISMQIGYRGMVELVYRSGRVADVWADVVRVGDASTTSAGAPPELSTAFPQTRTKTRTPVRSRTPMPAPGSPTVRSRSRC